VSSGSRSALPGPVGPSVRRQRYGPLLAWLALFVGGLLLASLATPLVYLALLELLPRVPWPFSRVFNRTAMVIAAVALYVFRRQLGWSALGELLGGRTAMRAGVEVLAGLGAALFGVVFAVAGALALDQLAPASSPYEFLATRTVTLLVGGLVVAIIEETFFRGLMLASLTSTVGFLGAAITSSGAYSIVHLLVSDPTLARRGYSVAAGLTYLAHAVGRQLEPASLLPLIGIFLCGLVLAVVVRRSGSLYLAIGLHAGWAFAFQVLRHTSQPLVEIPGHSFLATHHYLAGTRWAWAGAILSGFLALAWWALPAQRKRPEGAGRGRDT